MFFAWPPPLCCGPQVDSRSCGHDGGWHVVQVLARAGRREEGGG